MGCTQAQWNQYVVMTPAQWNDFVLASNAGTGGDATLVAAITYAYQNKLFGFANGSCPAGSNSYPCSGPITPETGGNYGQG